MLLTRTFSLFGLAPSGLDGLGTGTNLVALALAFFLEAALQFSLPHAGQALVGLARILAFGIVSREAALRIAAREGGLEANLIVQEVRYAARFRVIGTAGHKEYERNAWQYPN